MPTTVPVHGDTGRELARSPTAAQEQVGKKADGIARPHNYVEFNTEFNVGDEIFDESGGLRRCGKVMVDGPPFASAGLPSPGGRFSML